MHVKESQINILLEMVRGAGKVQEILNAPPSKVRYDMFDNEMILECGFRYEVSYTSKNNIQHQFI